MLIAINRKFLSINNFSPDFQNKVRSACPLGPCFPMPPTAIFSLTSADLPLTEITFAQSNPTSSRDDAVAPQGSRQQALQRRPTIHSTRNKINPTNSKIRCICSIFPCFVVISFTLLLRTFTNNS